MSWLDIWERRGREAIAAAAPIPVKYRKPAEPEPKPDLKSVWFQTGAPSDGNAGACEAGFYSVVDGVVTLRDETGKALGKSQALGPNDDARKIAGRLAREAWLTKTGQSNFNRPLSYPRVGFA